MLLTMVVSKFYYLPEEKWSVLNIFSSLLGNSVSLVPRNRKSKFFYMVLAIFSLFFMSDLISDLTKMQYLSEEKLLANSIKDVFDNNISV